MLERLFKLKKNNTNIKTEVVGGITTFMTMAYILAVNPQILSESGMDAQAVLMATAIAAFIGTMVMALFANYPFALAPGLGLNAYFTYTVVVQMGYSWQFALFAVFLEGVVFMVLSLTNIREAIFDAIPLQLKKGVSVGIGLFIAFIGLQNAKLVVADANTKVTIVNFAENFNTVGIGALLAIVEFLYENGAKAVHIRSACPPIMFGCKYLNFTRQTSDMELISKATIVELEGEEGLKHVSEYADPSTQRHKNMVEAMRKKWNLASLGFQSLDGLCDAIGIDKCKLCTYCWDGKEK